MLVKYYGLWDSVAKTLRTTFTAENDEVCVRSVREIVKEPKADLASLHDCIVRYLYTLESSTGEIVDVQQHDLLVMASIVEEARALTPVDNADIQGLKESVSKIITNMKNLIENDKTADETLKDFFSRLTALEKTVDQIINGGIKCQKYKKKK